MKPVKQTLGLYIESIRLESVSFAVVGEEDDAPKRLDTEQLTTLRQRAGERIEVQQLLKVTGFSGDKPIWEAACSHIGDFRVGPECPLPVEQIVDVHAPSYLYAFGRELLADLVRRSFKVLVLPPAAFAEASMQDGG